MEEKSKKFKKFGRKALAVCAGVIAACSIALGSLAGTPDELFSGVQPAAQVTASQTADDSRSPGKSKRADSAQKSRLRNWLRKVFFSQPSVVRGVVLLPFWAVGKALLLLISLLFTAMNPFLQILLGVLLNAALLFGLFFILLKLLFPNLRLRDLFKKRTILLIAACSVLLSVADAILRASWEDYRPISIAIKLGLGLFVLALLSYRIFGKRKPVRTHSVV
ncbi:MAG: hypothetical protein LLF75_04575 [Eubacteriales bacterium]|nr:hypothetical protein [Eubacteriales bacterium]